MKYTTPRERTRAAREVDTPQNWEALAESQPRAWERFSRADALDDLFTRFDADLARAQHEETRRLEHLAREYGSGAQAAPVAAGARRPGDEARAFRDLHQALTFVVFEPVLGIGPMNYVCAEDTDETRILRARRAARGRPLPIDGERPTGGYLPYDELPAHQSRSTSGRCRGVERVGLYCDTLRAFAGASVAAVAVHELLLVDIGVPMKHLAAANGVLVCPCGERAHKDPPGRPIKGSRGEQYMPITAAEQCRTWMFWRRARYSELVTTARTEEQVREELSRTRARLSTALIEGELLEGPRTSTRRERTPAARVEAEVGFAFGFGVES